MFQYQLTYPFLLFLFINSTNNVGQWLTPSVHMCTGNGNKNTHSDIVTIICCVHRHIVLYDVSFAKLGHFELFEL